MRLMALLLSLCLFAPQVGAQTPGDSAQTDNLLSNGDFTRDEEAWEMPADNAQAAVVDAAAGSFKRALRLTVSPRPGDGPFMIALRQPVGVALKKGQPLVLRIWMRAAAHNQVGAFLEEVNAPYAKSLSQVLTLTPEWREYEVRGTSLADYPADGSRIIFHLGYAPGTIEIAGVRLLAPGTQAAAGSTATPEHPVSLIINGDFSAPLAGNWGTADTAQLKSEVVPADAGPNGTGGARQALRLTINPEPGAAPWSVGIGQQVKQPVARDDAVYIQAWMRSPDRLTVGFIYELAKEPFTKTIARTARLTPEWKEYRFVGYAQQSFAPGESQVRFHVGYGKGVLEMTGIRVEDYGKAPKTMFHETIDYWGGNPPTDEWRAAAQERIENIRKADVKIRVLDAAGRPVPGATVKIEQKYHNFRFGTAGPAARLLDQTHPDSVRYRDEVKRLYNTFTFENDLKWPGATPQNVPRVEEAINWLHLNGVENVRGHNLLWGSKQYLPQDVQDLKPDELLKASHDHVSSLAARMRGKVYVWDVVNEAVTNTWLWDTIGWENFANAYKWAREADPDALLAYNDYDIINEAPGGGGHRAKARERIQYLLDHGAPLDIIGIQGHMGAPLTPVPRILQILDEMGAYGKQLEITEFDVGVPDDAVHGQYVRDCLTAFFSHPAVHGFIMWGFWEGSHWRAKDGGAMFRRDWTKRPAEDAYEDLVFHQWWTHATLTTGADGQATTRAFYGLHDVTVTKDGKAVSATLQLLPGGTGEMVVKLG